MFTSNKNHSASVAAALVAGVALFGLLSPAAASDRNDPAVLTSHLPWLAPIGHRQPARADAAQDKLLSPWSANNGFFDIELDRKLNICRGC
jgi:hypothetical protein